MFLLEAEKYTQGLVSWSKGLQILISSGLICEADASTDILWAKAVMHVVWKSVELLLPFKIHVTLDDWKNVNLFRTWLNDGDDRTTSSARGLRIFETLATRLWTHINLDSRCHMSAAGRENWGRPSPYCISYLSIWGAEGAWKAGFRDLNSAQGVYHDCATPLWLVSHDAARYAYSTSIWNVVQWLLDHGADPWWTHPVLLTTPAHIFTRGACMASCYRNTSTRLHGFEHFFTMPQRDRCICYCSQGGCCIAGCAISKHVYASDSYFRRQKQFHYRRKVQPYLFSLVDQNPDATWMSSAIFRRLTFEKLSLTHTCCYRIRDEIIGQFVRPTPEEAQDIYELECDDIKLLDTLVEEFKGGWANYNKPFVTFMNRVWKPRMWQVQQVKDEEAYTASLRALGVILKSSDEGHLGEVTDCESDSDWPDDYRSDEEGDGWHTTDEEDENDIEGQ
jgi:hypothetical protein